MTRATNLNQQLSVLSYANGTTLWCYSTQEDKEALFSEDYFSPASSVLRIGDFILCSFLKEGAHCGCLCFVSNVIADRVTVSPII